VRLKNIHLSNQLKRIEQTLRQKEELAEGLHLIDFEQLKIENQVGDISNWLASTSSNRQPGGGHGQAGLRGSGGGGMTRLVCEAAV